MAELLIDDVIGGDFFFEGITAKNVNAFLAENAKQKEVVVRFNSPGGDSIEGVAIYNALKRAADAGQRIIGEVDGLAASAASIILMACDEIRMHKGTFVMIHEAWTVSRGPADQHDKTAALLRKVNGEMADFYAARTGNTRDKCLELMADETWFTADAAKELGFCDVIVAAKTVAKKPEKAAAKMLAMFRRTPAALLAAFVRKPLEASEDEGARSEPQANRWASPLAALATGVVRIGDF